MKATINSFIYKDYPIKGVNFIDVFPFINSMEDSQYEDFLNFIRLHCEGRTVGLIESRAFIIGGLLKSMGIKWFPVRKAGKLPGDVIKIPIVKEYGKDTLVWRKSDLDGSEIVIFDDIIATGGTLSALSKSLMDEGFKVSSCICMIEIEELNGKANLNPLGVPVYSYIKY